MASFILHGLTFQKLFPKYSAVYIPWSLCGGSGSPADAADIPYIRGTQRKTLSHQQCYPHSHLHDEHPKLLTTDQHLPHLSVRRTK